MSHHTGAYPSGLRQLRRALQLALLLLAAVMPGSLGAVEVTFLYWSDFHARNLPDTVESKGSVAIVGGAANLAGLVERRRTASPRTLVVNAGDEFTGTPVSSLTKGASQIRLLSYTGVDLFVPGNHEFDHGWRSLLDVLASEGRPNSISKGLSFLAGEKRQPVPVLLGNVFERDATVPLFQADSVYDLSGVKVAVVGLIYEEFTGSVSRAGIEGIEAVPMAEIAGRFVKRHIGKVDLLAAVTHAGWRNDSLLAARVPELGVIIGAHSHTVINPPRVVGRTVIVQSGPYGRHLGRLVVHLDTAANRLLEFEGELLPIREGEAPPSKAVARQVELLEKKYTRKLNRQLGTLAGPWRRFPAERSNLGQWAVDALHQASPRASLAVINSGNLRRDLDVGPILERHLWEIFPFENGIVVFQISGDELRRVVRNQLGNKREQLIWSGLKVTAYRDAAQQEQILVRDLPITAFDEFSVVTTSYIWDQLEGYLGLDKTDRPVFFLPGSQREEMIKAVQRQRVVDSKADDRWQVR